MRILIVDDNNINLLFLEKLLIKNHQIEKAINGVEALQTIPVFNPDILLLDIMMPVMDGITTLKKIRNNYITAQLPVIIVTAKEDQSSIKEALDAGASDYIKKPIDITELYSKIKIQSQLLIEQKKSQDYEVYRNINESMIVAKRFQQSLLPDKKKKNDIFPENFVLNIPKDFVSGDFYNMYEFNNRKIVSLIDCIGHGVPAAMMTIAIQLIASRRFEEENKLGLQEIVRRMVVDFKQNINQSSDTFTYFSFDAVFLEIDEKQMIANFIGAQRPLLVVRENAENILVNDKLIKPYMVFNNYSLFRIKGNLQSVNVESTDFKCHKINILKDDLLYMFSDGFTEQLYAGFNKTRISLKGLSKILIENQHLTMQEQKSNLYQILINNLQGSLQLDDIMIIGIKI